MQVGQRVSYNGELCTIRYVGAVEGTKGEWLGVEWDDPTRGKHYGEANGKRYFTCQSKEPKAASFIRPTRPADKDRTFLEALRFKYASEHIKIIQIGQAPLSIEEPIKPIRISGKEAEEVGFDKISKRLADLYELRIVLLDGLCIRQPLDEEAVREIREVCPNITELDLSRNLFSSLEEVAGICLHLEHLRILRLDGNRFGEAMFPTEKEPSSNAFVKRAFAKVENLSLDNTLLSWQQIVDVCHYFPNLKTLSTSSNEYTLLDESVLLASTGNLKSLKLESNKFTSLASLLPLAKVPTLQHLGLKFNDISTVGLPSKDIESIFTNITDLDVSHNAITTWSFINSLAPAFPFLTSLRISHNPLYTALHSPAGKELTADDGYMLTIARLPRLKTLNFSAVTEKDRMNAETYYISLIVQELCLAEESEEGRILEGHPRWRELCEEYGEPAIKREGGHVDPRSLAARLLTLKLSLSPNAATLFGLPVETTRTIKYVPKRFNIYSLFGSVVKAFGQSYVVPGLSLSLETEDWEKVDGVRAKRCIRLVPETRGIGTFVESRIGNVVVQYEEVDFTKFEVRPTAAMALAA